MIAVTLLTRRRQAMVRWVLIAAVTVLPGCSVAALMQTDSLDKRVQTLEQRVHALEEKQAASSTVKPAN